MEFGTLRTLIDRSSAASAGKRLVTVVEVEVTRHTIAQEWIVFDALEHSCLSEREWLNQQRLVRSM